MADEVRLEAELRGVAGDLSDMSRRFRSVMLRLDTSRGKNEGQWGSDEFGASFAGGNGYNASSKNIDAAVESKADMLDNYGQALIDAANELDGMDIHNGTTF